MQEIKAEFARKNLRAEGLSTSRRTYEQQPTLRGEPMSCQVGLRTELFHNAFDSLLDLWRQHDLRSGPLWMMNLDERRVTIGIARESCEWNNFLRTCHGSSSSV
jgi:hypothetical protein